MLRNAFNNARIRIPGIRIYLTSNRKLYNAFFYTKNVYPSTGIARISAGISRSFYHTTSIVQQVEDKESKFLLGLSLIKQVESSKESLEESSSIQDVKRDIEKLRKSPRSLKGSKQDFEKAKELRDKRLKENIETSNNKEPIISLSNITVDARTEGMRLLAEAALEGHAQAMCYLGNDLLQRSQIGDLEIKTAVICALDAADWYRKGAELGCADAAFNLGVVYHDGVTCEQNPPVEGKMKAKSSKLQLNVTKVTNSKTDEACSVEVVKSDLSQNSAAGNFEVAVEVDLPLSLRHFERAALLGDPAAALWCGHCFSTGEGGAVQLAPTHALKYLSAAACSPQTAAKAHYYLTQIYRSGLEATDEEDTIAASVPLFLEHLRAACDLRDEDALYVLADLHLQHYIQQHGEGTEQEQEDPEVLEFLKSDLHASTHHHCEEHHDHTVGDCAAHHHDHAQCDHPHHNHSSDCATHLDRSLSLLIVASAAGQASASLTLGALTYQGLAPVLSGPNEEGSANPKRRAFELYSLAADQGSLEAWRNIASMHFLGDGVPRCENTAREIMRVVFGKK